MKKGFCQDENKYYKFKSCMRLTMLLKSNTVCLMQHKVAILRRMQRKICGVKIIYQKNSQEMKDIPILE